MGMQTLQNSSSASSESTRTGSNSADPTFPSRAWSCPSRTSVANLRLILSLAARCKGIARCAALHLDCARSAEGEVVIGCVRGAIALPEWEDASTLDREVAQRFRDSRFHAFQLLLRHRVSLGFFNEVI